LHFSGEWKDADLIGVDAVTAKRAQARATEARRVEWVIQPEKRSHDGHHQQDALKNSCGKRRARP